MVGAMSAYTAEEQAWITKLNSSEYSQDHLIDANSKPEDVKRMIAQIQTLDSTYPGGLLNYVQRAQKLLIDSRDGANPFDGYVPVVPVGNSLTTGTPDFSKFEKIGLENIHKMSFVLVAGGLGERLGFSDIKVALPIETVTRMCYMEYYIRMILACEEYAAKTTGIRPRLPLAIMTSEDTHKKTVDLLRQHGSFGFPEDQLTIMVQQKVPALIDNDGRMATVSTDRYTIETKPHGHGDVHTLLNQHGLPKKWVAEGKEWMLIFQDTNGLVSHAIAPMLGVSVENKFVMNSLTCPRKPGEAIGAICKLVKDDSHLTINVEYNQLNPLLLATGKGGDIADPATGFSQFPGNTNVLLFSLPRYADVLQSTGGAIPEFVNPKYKDATKTVFKSPARLECMMQEFPRLFGKDDIVGMTQLDRWMCFSTVKNNTADAAAKSKQGTAPESVFTGECDTYFANAKLLQLAGEAIGCEVDIAAPIPTTYLDIDYKLGPKVVMYPSFGISLEQIKNRIKASKLRLAQGSTLVLEGNVCLRGLDLEGTLFASAIGESKLQIQDLQVRNGGWEFAALEEADTDAVLTDRIRGYKMLKVGQTRLLAE